jgi:hypothetical protein
MTFKQFKKAIRQKVLSLKLKFAIRWAKRYYERINGTESVHIFLQRNRFVILSRSHTRKLIRRGFFKKGINWSDIKQNAIYTIDKRIK